MSQRLVKKEEDRAMVNNFVMDLFDGRQENVAAVSDYGTLFPKAHMLLDHRIYLNAFKTRNQQYYTMCS
jgi:hypothetical protein